MKKIKGKQIAKNAITSKKIKNGTIQAADAKPGEFLTPAQGNAAYQPKGSYQPAGSYLAGDGKAADSDKLDGIDSTGFLAVDGKAADSDELDGFNHDDFMKGSARHNAVTVSGGAAKKTLLKIDGLLQVLASCPGGSPLLEVDYLGNIRQVHHDYSSSTGATDAETIASATASTPSTPYGSAEFKVGVSTVRYGGLGTEVTEITLRSADEGADCAFSAMAFAQDSRFRSGIVLPPINP